MPKHHVLRRIDAAVDFSFVREEVAELYTPDRGRPSVDPELALRMMLIGYLFDLSEKRLCEEIAMHAAYRWFCRLEWDEPVPDRTTLLKLRAHRWGPRGVFDRLFQRIVAVCVQAGVVRAQNVGVDGTRVDANAAMSSLEAIEPPVSIEQYLARFEEASRSHRSTSKDDDEAGPPAQGGGGSARKAGDPDFRGERFRNATHRSKTDPDARLYRKSRGQEARLSYLAHYLGDLDTGVILGQSATLAHGYAEREAARDMLERFNGGPWGLSITHVGMDAGYADGSFLADLHELGIEALVPMRQNKLEPIPEWKRRTFSLQRYRARQQKVRIAEARNQARVLQGTRLYRRVQKRRCRIEHLFGEAKQWHHLDRARGWGLANMQIQTAMTAIVQNLKRVVYYRGHRHSPAAEVAQQARPAAVQVAGIGGNAVPTVPPRSDTVTKQTLLDRMILTLLSFGSFSTHWIFGLR